MTASDTVDRLGRARRAGRTDDDEVALREAYRAYGPELFRLAARSLGDRGLAEEVVQETFVRAWRHEGRFDAARGSMRTWLWAIARNLVIDAARRRASRPPLAGADLAPPPASADHAERVAVRLQVAEALERVSPEHQHVIVEVHYRGRPHAEVAAELGVPPGTVRSRLYYGLRALRLALEEMGWSDER